MNTVLTGVIFAISGFALNQTLEDFTHAVFDDVRNAPRNNKTRLVQYAEGVMLLMLLICGTIELDREIPQPIKNKIEKMLFITPFWVGGGVVIANLYNAWKAMRE